MSTEESRKRRCERESFILLQHVYTLASDDLKRSIRVARAAADLGLASAECWRLVDHLVRAGCLDEVGRGGELSLTATGVHYVERGAGRRRSVRTPAT